MGKQVQRQEQSEPAAFEPVVEPAAGAKCRFCGVDLPGATAQVCIPCFRDRAVRCPACTNERSTLSHLFKWHYRLTNPANRDVIGEPIPEAIQTCAICQTVHTETYFRRTCTVCHNRRFVFRETPGVMGNGGNASNG